MRVEPIAQGTEQRVVVEPVGLAIREGGEFPGAWRVAIAVLVVEALEGRPERALLERAHTVVVDGGGGANGRKLPAIRGRQGRFAALGGELGHVAEAQEDRVDGHRRDRGVRRVLIAGRHLVDREHQQPVEAGAAQPRREGDEIGDLADAPAVGGGGRKERKEDAGVALAEEGIGGSRHRRSFVILSDSVPAAATIRSSPRAKTSGTTRRLTISHASVGKS